MYIHYIYHLVLSTELVNDALAWANAAQRAIGHMLPSTVSGLSKSMFLYFSMSPVDRHSNLISQIETRHSNIDGLCISL